jgi:hypothetical protein
MEILFGLLLFFGQELFENVGVEVTYGALPRKFYSLPGSFHMTNLSFRCDVGGNDRLLNVLPIFPDGEEDPLSLL